MSDQVALLRLHHVHRSSRTGRHRRSAIRGHRHTRWAYLARHWPGRGAQAGRCAGHRRSQSHRCRKACATPPARDRSTRPPHHAIARAPWHKLRSERCLSTRRSNRGGPAMAENLLFLTGKLAEDRLTEMVQCLDFPAGSWAIDNLNIKVAALMTEASVKNRRKSGGKADRIIVPGRSRMDRDSLSRHYGVPVVRGPDEII